MSQPPKSRRAILYLRVSDPRQVENLSLDLQEKACHEFCERNGWEVVATFREEGESAKTADRTQLKNLLAWCGRGGHRADVMLVYRLSRAARNAADYHTLKALLASRRIELISVTETRGDSPAEHLLENVIAAVNQFDNEVRAEQARNGMMQAALQGRWVWRPPLGYRRGVGKSLQIDPSSGPAIRRAFELAASGCSLPEIAESLRHAGLRTSQGKAFAMGYLDRLLQSPFYRGRLVNHGWKIDVPGQWEPLVSDEVWNRAQLARSKKGRPELCQKRMKARPDFPLKRFVSCDHCGSPTTASWSRGRSRYYGYYHCVGCRDLRVKKESLEDAFFELLQGLQPDPAVLALWREIVTDVWNQRYEEMENRGKAAVKQVEILKSRRERLIDLALDASVDKRTFQRKMQDLDLQLVEAELAASEGQDSRPELGVAIEHAETFLSNCAVLWRDGTSEIRTRFQNLVFPEGLAYRQKSGFRTAVTMRIFSDLRDLQRGKLQMVPPTGFEPVSPA